MTNFDLIQRLNIGGIQPFINADRRFMVSVLVELSMCESCPWLPDLYWCKQVQDRDNCRRKVEEYLDAEAQEISDCSKCPAANYCAELETEYPNCEIILKEYGGSAHD